MANELVINNDTAVSITEKYDIEKIVNTFQKEIHLFDTYVAGTYYAEEEGVFEEIKPGDEVIYKREPDNFFDKNAILVLTTDGKCLGYIPEKDNIVFARLMDAGKRLKGNITDVMQDEEHTHIEIGIDLVDL